MKRNGKVMITPFVTIVPIFMVMMLKSVKYDLRKKENNSLNCLMVEFVLNHPKFVFITLFVVLAALFALLFNWLYWMSATEHIYYFRGV